MDVVKDERAFRTALGRFATGITVVTAVDAAGDPVGLTVNSFNSVSLDPPLVLWSLALKSEAMVEAFSAASHFAIHVLKSDQQKISDWFAYDKDKFLKIEYEAGLGGAPLISGCLARFECRNLRQIEGGDHVIYLGQVEKFVTGLGEPLLYFGGGYGSFCSLESK